MTVQEMIRLFDYMYWANKQMWQCVLTLDEAQQKINLDYSIGSVHDQLVHLVSVENLWVNYLWHGEVEFIDGRMLNTLSQIRKEWDALEQEMRDYLSTLTDDDLNQVITVKFATPSTVKLKDILLQILNHATDHRAQILAGINRLGGKTVEQDYFRYLAQPTVA